MKFWIICGIWTAIEFWQIKDWNFDRSWKILELELRIFLLNLVSVHFCQLLVPLDASLCEGFFVRGGFIQFVGFWKNIKIINYHNEQKTIKFYFLLRLRLDELSVDFSDLDSDFSSSKLEAGTIPGRVFLNCLKNKNSLIKDLVYLILELNLVKQFIREDGLGEI